MARRSDSAPGHSVAAVKWHCSHWIRWHQQRSFPHRGTALPVRAQESARAQRGTPPCWYLLVASLVPTGAFHPRKQSSDLPALSVLVTHVAAETYQQKTGSQSYHSDSHCLWLKPPQGGSWTSFIRLSLPAFELTETVARSMRLHSPELWHSAGARKNHQQ